ncbi:hypothetical protein MBLNU459_g0154t1 [Dothideomycetes sp. NU459]
MPVKFYVVKAGRATGVFHSWDECLDQVKGYKGAIFKSFKTLTEAQKYLDEPVSSSQTARSKVAKPKFYGVAAGHVRGVYTDWESAESQIKGWPAPRFKAFATWAEADAFVNGTDEDDELTKQPAAKKRKTGPSDEPSLTPTPGSDVRDVEYAAGEGPLPNGAEDGFDPRIMLDPTAGKIVYKSERQQRATKWVATGPTESGMLNIYTDGSSLGNGAHGAVAGVGVYFGPRNPNNLSEPLPGTRQTNQRAELTAIQRALELAPRNRPVTIFSDSNYAIKCVTEWFVKWRANGWVNAAKKPVENKDIVEKVLLLLEERHKIGGKGAQVEFKWVKGHRDNEGNNAADELAVAGAREARTLHTAGRGRTEDGDDEGDEAGEETREETEAKDAGGDKGS